MDKEFTFRNFLLFLLFTLKDIWIFEWKNDHNPLTMEVEILAPSVWSL